MTSGVKCEQDCQCGRHQSSARLTRREVCAKGHPIVERFGQRCCETCRTEGQRRFQASRRRARGAPLLRYQDRTHCKRGHALTHDNILIRKASDRKSGKRRQCRICDILNCEARRARIAGTFVEYVDPMVVYARDNGICGICSLPVHVNQFHIDHIKPLAKGGEHSYANVQIAHPSCNCKKHTKTECYSITALS